MTIRHCWRSSVKRCCRDRLSDGDDNVTQSARAILAYPRGEQYAFSRQQYYFGPKADPLVPRPETPGTSWRMRNTVAGFPDQWGKPELTQRRSQEVTEPLLSAGSIS
jgi:phage baseplate assembly protein W